MPLQGKNSHICQCHYYIKGVQHPWALFLESLCIFSKNKQLCTKYSMDLVRNVPRNSKITVLLQ